MTSYINDGRRGKSISVNWRVDLSERLNWLYPSANRRLYDQWADVLAWRNLGLPMEQRKA